MVTVVCDVRERASAFPERLQELGALVAISHLPAGDYVVGDGCIVERKHVVDLHNSLLQQHQSAH